ncbi:MAG: hypothetical protein RXR20_25305 [Paraburkholderia sp.]|uniref:hypothetical protein n=1 Tax=Burkholderiaceae TaxID=119060 RepID=UPI0010F8D159|nr:hypothetical protein [Burkholderia sp. 4M9327F10]
MKPDRTLLSRPVLAMLAAWSVLCASASQVHFPHFLFICEQVEAYYDGMADDAVVYRVMQSLVASVWALGVVAIAAGAWMARAARVRR